MLTDFLIRAVRDAFFHHLHRTIAGAHIRHSPSTRFVYACVCVYVYSCTCMYIRLLTRFKRCPYSTSFTIGLSGSDVSCLPKIIPKCCACVGRGVCFVMQSATIASVLTYGVTILLSSTCWRKKCRRISIWRVAGLFEGCSPIVIAP